MKHKTMIVALVAAGTLGAASFGAYTLGMQHGMHMTQPAAAASKENAGGDHIDPATGKKVLYWHDPMVPGPKFDKPGKSPFMDMQLVPVYADQASDDGSVSISPRVQQNLGVRTAEVVRGNLDAAVEVVGNVAYNERDLEAVQARASGYVERLYVRAALDHVRKGQPLAQLYVPDWVAAQEEYLSVKHMGNGAGTEGLLDAARQRMRLAGMTDDLIRQVAAGGKVQPRLSVTAPIDGVVTALDAREGMTVMSGAPLFRINGLSTVWVNAEVPENLAARVRPGTAVEARSPAFPDLAFKGKVGALLPQVDAATRTIKARIELANPSGQLVPGMFVNINLNPAGRKDVLLVPSEAVIQTGARSVVLLAQGDGKFLPAEVETGTEANGRTEIRKGLQAGQKVVASGQFLIDSEASLKGTVARMSGMPNADGKTPGTQVAPATHHGTGKVESIGKDDITLSHGPIPSLQWGPMTMGFKLPSAGLPKNIAVGDTVTFDIRQDKDGMYEIVSIAPTADAPKPGEPKAGRDGAAQ